MPSGISSHMFIIWALQCKQTQNTHILIYTLVQEVVQISSIKFCFKSFTKSSATRRKTRIISLHAKFAFKLVLLVHCPPGAAPSTFTIIFSLSFQIAPY
ncbi:unnamed protein product [Sphagnum jensenii]|uniref:Uncharacterized protein n=1 Tax=Sphagnum jensenii TaxID=128206 RepID=A0ABP0XGU9_9BRYO